MEDHEHEPDTEPTNGRRDLFAKAGAAAAVAAVAGLAASQKVEAVDGSIMHVGETDDGTLTTKLIGGTTFKVEDGDSDGAASIFGSQSNSDGYGVYGLSTGTGGAGVYGNNTGTDGAGVLGRNSFSGGNAIFGDNTAENGWGVYGRNTGDGTTGGGVYGSNSGAAGNGVYGIATNTGGNGVYGVATESAGAGVYGTHGASRGVGVYGHHNNSTTPGTGVLGVTVVGAGVVGRGGSYDLQADSSGKVGLTKAGNSGGPTASGSIGTIARDAAGNLWYCYATNKWQRLGGPTAAGSFHPISPIRAFDSRIAAVPSSGGFAAAETRQIVIKDGRDQATGAVTEANAVPTGAKAVAFNVTCTNTGSPGFLAVVPGDVNVSAVSTLNWTGGGISIANAGIVGVDGSLQITVYRRIAVAPGIELDVAEVGSPGDPVVVLLHGFPESAHSWRHQMEPLATAGYHVLAPNQRGYASSSAPGQIGEYRIDHLAGDVCGLLDDVGAERAAIVGHDWGAMVAWNMGLLHPERCRAVVGVSVPLTRPPAPPTQLFKMLHGDRFFYILYFQEPGVAEAEFDADPEQFLRSIIWTAAGESSSLPDTEPPPADGTTMAAAMELRLGRRANDTPLWLDEIDFKVFAEQFRLSGFDGPLNWYRNLDANYELTKDIGLDTLSMPTAFVAGAADPVITGREDALQQMAGSLPAYRGTTLIDGVGHWVQQEAPHQFTRSLLGFLDGV